MHSPSVAPCAFEQRPLQHSKSVAHTSVVCEQNEPLPVQSPFWQTFEQQSPWFAHVLPTVRHDGLSGVHVPAPASPAPPHVPLQHCAELVQAW
jgi:hypothetical protein